VAGAVVALEPGAPRRREAIAIALNHFGQIFSQHEFQRSCQQEMRPHQSAGERRIDANPRETVFQAPFIQKMQETVQEGIRTAAL